MKNNSIIGIAIAVLLAGCATFAVCMASDSSENQDMTTVDSGDMTYTENFAMLGAAAANGDHVNKTISNVWISCDGYTTLMYSTSNGNGLKVVDYKQKDKDFIKVPDYVVYEGETYVVDEILSLHTTNLIGWNPVKVELGPNIVTIHDGAFDSTIGLNKLSEITFRDIEHSKLEKIKMWAFKRCEFTSLELPSSVNFIGNEAFINSSLADLKFNPNRLVNVGIKAFAGCGGLKSFPFESANVIGYGAFSGCKFINHVDLSNCWSIGNKAFEGCNIDYIKFGDIIFHIGSGLLKYDFYDADGNRLERISQLYGMEFNLVDGKLVAVQ